MVEAAIVVHTLINVVDAAAYPPTDSCLAGIFTLGNLGRYSSERLVDNCCIYPNNEVDAACLRTSNKIGLVYTYRNVDRYSLQALIGNTGVMYISLKLSIYS